MILQKWNTADWLDKGVSLLVGELSWCGRSCLFWSRIHPKSKLLLNAGITEVHWNSDVLVVLLEASFPSSALASCYSFFILWAIWWKSCMGPIYWPWYLFIAFKLIWCRRMCLFHSLHYTLLVWLVCLEVMRWPYWVVLGFQKRGAIAFLYLSA